jgi:hypothetical protein
MESMEIGYFKVIIVKIELKFYFLLKISRKGYLAVLQDNFIEIYSNYDSFSHHIWRKEVKTNCSQLCCICWNDNSNLLIIVNEYSNYFLFDEYGKELAQYTEVFPLKTSFFFIQSFLIIQIESLDYENALNKVVFTNHKNFGDIILTDGM